MSEPDEIEDAATGTSLEDTIRSEYQKLAAQEPEVAADTEDAPELATPRSRDDKGKFAKTASEPTPVDTPAVAAAAQPFDAYPGSWKKDHEPKWKALDAGLREEIHRREQNFLDGIKEYKESSAFGKAIGQDLLPHLDTFRKLNTTPQAVVRDLMGTWSRLVTGDKSTKQQILLRIASDYGIDMPAGAAPSPQIGAPPSANQPDFTPVLQRVEGIEQALQAQQAERQRLESAQIDADIARFAADTKNEHFSTVREEMGRLMTAGSAATLQEAYDKAVWLVPEVRTKIQAKDAEVLRQRQADEAAAARKAASANVTRRGTPPQVPKAGSMDDTIREQYRRLSAEA